MNTLICLAAAGATLLLFLFALERTSAVGPAAMESSPRYVTIASAEPLGAYHRRALTICRLVNEACAANGPRCVVEPTEGSAQNITFLDNGNVDFAIVQSDVAQPDAQHYGPCPPSSDVAERDSSHGERPAGPSQWASSGASVLPYQEALFVFVRVEESAATLKTFFKNKRILAITLGPEGSGTRQFAKKLLDVAGVSMDLVEDRPLQFDQGIRALCEKRVGAVFRVTDATAETLPAEFLAGHCKVKLLNIDQCLINGLNQKQKAGQSYRSIQIRYQPDTRPNTDDSESTASKVFSIGPHAILVVHARLADSSDGQRARNLVCQASTMRIDKNENLAPHIAPLTKWCNNSLAKDPLRH